MNFIHHTEKKTYSTAYKFCLPRKRYLPSPAIVPMLPPPEEPAGKIPNTLLSTEPPNELPELNRVLPKGGLNVFVSPSPKAFRLLLPDEELPPSLLLRSPPKLAVACLLPLPLKVLRLANSVLMGLNRPGLSSNSGGGLARRSSAKVEGPEAMESGRFRSGRFRS